MCARVHVCFEAEPYIVGHAASQHLAVPTAKVNLFWSPGLHTRFPSSTMQRQGGRGSSRLAQSSGLRAGTAANDVHTSRATPCRPCPPQPLALPGTITGPGTGPMSCSLVFQTCYSGQHSAPSLVSLTQLQGTTVAPTRRRCRQVWLDHTPTLAFLTGHEKAHHHPFLDTKNILNPFSQ